MNESDKYSHSHSSDASRDDGLDAEKLKDQGREAAHDIGEAAEHQAEHFYSEQRKSFADQAHKFTDVMNKTADEFDSNQQPFFSQQARKAAQYADQFSNQLRDKDLRHLCQDAQSYSRREPAIFIGGAIAAGFLVARFLRSSSTHSHASHDSRRGPQPGVNDWGHSQNAGRSAYGGGLNERSAGGADGQGYQGYGASRTTSTPQPGSGRTPGSDDPFRSER